MKSRPKLIVLSLIIISIISIYAYKLNRSEFLTDKEIQWLEEQDEIIYAANNNAPPLRFVDKKDNQYKGVVIDYINQISLELGVEMQTVPMRWDKALESLSNGETQICDMFVNEERSKHYLFTNPIYNLRSVLVVKNGQDFDLKQINHMIIATEKGDYANNYLEQHYPDATLLYVNNINEGLNLLIDGSVEAVIGDEPVITYLLNTNENLQSLNLYNYILYEEEVVFAVSKLKPELVPILNKAIKQINKRGQLEKIQQKWFGISTPLITNSTKNDIISIIIVPAFLLGIVLIFISLNNLSLKKQVKIRTKELEHSKNELQIIFDGISEYMLVVGLNKKIINGNKGLADYLSIQSDSMIGQTCDNYLKNFCVNCSECQIDETLILQKNIQREKLVGNEIFEMISYPLKGAENTVLISLKNITIEKINKNKILQANKMIAVGQLAAGMAHEIRNPLGIIRTQSYLLRICDKIDEQMKKSLDYIDTGVSRASSIIDNILNFSRISSDNNEIIVLYDMISGIMVLQEDLIKKKKINVVLSCEKNEKISLNMESLKHIILNITSNAIDSMNDNGILKISAILENEEIILSFEDNGRGIDKKNIEKIFNPFFTTKELGRGTGLGLFIVYSEVEKLGGKIEVQSDLGVGTKFTVTIPRKG